MVFLSNKIQPTHKYITSTHVSPFTTTSRKSIWTEQRFETSTAGSDEEGILYVPLSEEDDESEVSEEQELEEPLTMDTEKKTDINLEPLITKPNIGEEDIDPSFIEEELSETSLSEANAGKHKTISSGVKNPLKHIYARRFFCTTSPASKRVGDSGAHYNTKQAFMGGPRNDRPKPVYTNNKPTHVPKRIYKESDPEVIESRRVFAQLLATPMKKREFLLAMLRWDGPEPAIYNPDYNKTVEPERDEHGYLIELTLEEREAYRREEERLLGSQDESSSSSSSGVGTIEDLSEKMSLIPRQYFTSVLENQIMRKGKRSTAHSICRNMMNLLRSGYNITNPYIQIEECLKDLLPLLIPRQLGSARSAKKKIDVQFIDERRSTFLASDWIVDAAKKNSYKGYRRMCVNLCSEIQNVWLGKETPMTKKRDSYYKDIWGMYNFIEDVSGTSLISSDSADNPSKTSKRLQSASRKPSKKAL